MIMHVAFGLIVTSPVIRPTSLNSSCRSRYFWLLRALMGEVYMSLCLSRKAIERAYSATAVFPADVCAETSTDSFRSRQVTASCWNLSRVKPYSRAGFFSAALAALFAAFATSSAGLTTSWVQPLTSSFSYTSSVVRLVGGSAPSPVTSAVGPRASGPSCFAFLTGTSGPLAGARAPAERGRLEPSFLSGTSALPGGCALAGDCAFVPVESPAARVSMSA
mmetsp:Transcript_105064/g.297436  ORF Transcript_105064/g.297436 Transcript_105064/m.297436 type:complete len:220 (-) Transcript_105064:38-697(-)